jgi:hypothetical protein
VPPARGRAADAAVQHGPAAGGGARATLVHGFDYTCPTGCVRLARPEPGCARAFRDKAQHGNETVRVSPPGLSRSDPVAFKRIMLGQRPVWPYRVGPVRSPDIRNIFTFSINLVI